MEKLIAEEVVESILANDKESFMAAFNAALAAKVNDALEVKKVEVASSWITPEVTVEEETVVQEMKEKDDEEEDDMEDDEEESDDDKEDMKEEVEQTDEAIRVTMANRQLPPKSKRRVAGGAPTKSDIRRDVAAAAAKEKRSMYGNKRLPMGGINALNVLMPKKMPKGQETWFVGAKKTNEEVEQKAK
jgi:hypothetical protein